MGRLHPSCAEWPNFYPLQPANRRDRVRLSSYRSGASRLPTYNGGSSRSVPLLALAKRVELFTGGDIAAGDVTRGHGAWRETFGGVTRGLLKTSCVPLILSH